MAKKVRSFTERGSNLRKNPDARQWTERRGFVCACVLLRQPLIQTLIAGPARDLGELAVESVGDASLESIWGYSDNQLVLLD